MKRKEQLTARFRERQELPDGDQVPREERASPLLHLQRTLGNRALRRFVLEHDQVLPASEDSGDRTRALDLATPTRPVGADHFENEANRVAEKVLGGRSLPLEAAKVAQEPGRQTHAGGSLPQGLRRTAEPLLGFDLSSVHLRTATPTDLASAPAGTLAFTRGNTISFAPGSYRPELPIGQALIAHELTHVVQQRAVPALPDLALGAEGLRRKHSADIDAFHAGHSDARLASSHDALADSSGREPIRRAPSGMQQRTTGCDGCGETSDQTPAPTPAPKPSPPPSPAPSPSDVQGAKDRDAAKKLLEQQGAAKAARDQLESALQEIRAGKALGFHGQKTPDVIKKAAAALRISEAPLLSEWDWFLKNGPPGAKPRADDKTWAARRQSFLNGLQTLLDKLAQSHPRSQATFFFKNTPAKVFALIEEVAIAAVPPALLYAVTGVEGLVDEYIRPQVSSPTATDKLTESELAGVKVTEPVSGFNQLGLDDFFTELENKRKPLRGFFPTGFDETKVTESRQANEKGREVRSADAPDLKTALQAALSVIARRQALFQEDAKSLGYATPTSDELVYFTYVYYNSGPGDPTRGDGSSSDNGGYQTLSRHRPQHPDKAARRKLADWIRLKEYKFALKVLDTYKAIVGSGVLKGY